jgi:hypothetical protein
VFPVRYGQSSYIHDFDQFQASYTLHVPSTRYEASEVCSAVPEESWGGGGCFDLHADTSAHTHTHTHTQWEVTRDQSQCDLNPAQIINATE